jgi:hypothetical protein
VQAATGAILPALQPPLPQELIAALGSMSGLHGAAPVPQPSQAAGAGMLPGSWPLHLMGLLRPPSLPVPNVMQLAMMMQAAAQAAVLPGGGGLQQTAMLVAALQSMAASNMQGLLGPWGPGMATWQQQQQQVVQQMAPHTQNNGSCLGQYGQGHLMSHGTHGFGGQGYPKAATQPGSHVQGGSHMGGSHHVGSHLQTSTTGDYSGQAGDAGCMHRQSAAAAAGGAGAYGSNSQWGMCNQQQQQQQWPQHQQQWHAASAAELEAAAAELAAVEAITPRHSRQHPQHKASGKRGGRIADSRRSRASNRLRVKGRFVKLGTPGRLAHGVLTCSSVVPCARSRCMTGPWRKGVCPTAC